MKGSLNIALLAAIVGAAHGHTMGMCTMTSPTIPNRAVVMMPNYHSVSGSYNPPGDITATTIGGDVFTFAFTNKCSPDVFWGSSVGAANEIGKVTADMHSTTNPGSCGNQIVGGKAVSDINTEVTCYTADTSPLFSSSLNFAWDMGHAQKQMQCYSSNKVQSYYLLVLDNLPPATYVFSGTTSSVDLAPYNMVPCNVIGSTPNYGPKTFIDISVSDGATACASAPTFPLNTLASTEGRCTPNHANAGNATSFVSGWICPAKCDAGFLKTGTLLCRNGAWVSTMTCTQDACLRPLVGGSGNAAALDAGTNETNGVLPSTTCGVHSAVGSVCGFTCAGNSFGCGTITCGTGNVWTKTTGSSDQCITQANDVVTLAPSTTVTQLSSYTIKIQWTKPICSASAACCSPIQRYTFTVAGYTVNCPDYLGSEPPSGGVTCNVASGPTFSAGTNIVVDAYAVNAKGSSATDSAATTTVTPSAMAADASVTYTPTSAPVAPPTPPTASPTSAAPSAAPTTTAPLADDAAAAFQETPAGIAVFTVVPILVILITIVIVIIIIILVLVCLRKKTKKVDTAPMAEMVVMEEVPAVVSVEQQIANECAAKYPLIKVDLAHGHLIPLKSLEFLPNSADPEEPELFDALLQQLGACIILANDHLPDERDIHLVIGGHTDCPKEKATTSYFINLSNKRAESVKAHLVKMHPELDASHLYPKGYGGARPIPGAIVGEGDRPNMRITFEATVASAVDAIITAEVVYEGLE